MKTGSKALTPPMDTRYVPGDRIALEDFGEDGSLALIGDRMHVAELSPSVRHVLSLLDGRRTLADVVRKAVGPPAEPGSPSVADILSLVELLETEGLVKRIA